MNEKIKELHDKLADVKNDALTIIRNVMDEHEGRTANFLEGGSDIPSVFDADTDDGIYTLDRVRMDDGDIILEISNSYDLTEIRAEDAPIQVLVLIAELIEVDADTLFADYDEEDEE